MINEVEARRLAEAALAEKDRDACVIMGVDEYEVGWIYFWNSKRYQQSGDPWDTLVGNAPILVDRTDGSVHFTGTARPVSEYVDRYLARDPDDERSWHP